MNAIAQNTAPNDFKDLYFNLRQKEGRVYTDKELAYLPLAPSSHPHYKEWKIRQRSATRLVNYLRKKQSPLQILEVGCGNGWLSYMLASVRETTVTGLDINVAELRQAQRVFGRVPNLKFIYADIHSEILKHENFDCIVLAACIQYFPSLSSLLKDLSYLLRQDGEIHILDSPFYKPGEIAAASKRSDEYYRGIGFPEMSRHYFHHEEAALKEFSYETLYRPSAFQSFLLNNKNPFPWFCIKKGAF